MKDFETWDYARLKALEVRGYKAMEEMRKAPKMTPEAVCMFIQQLSPWNIKTTGVSILETFTAITSGNPPREQ